MLLMLPHSLLNLRGVTVETLAAQTSENFFRLFSQAQR